MASLGWMCIPVHDLAHVAAGYSSCIGDDQLLRLADGTIMTATDIADAFRNDRRIDFRTLDISGALDCANPVIGVVRTHAHAVRIGFADGRSVALTTGHVLPLSDEWLDDGNDHWLPVRQQKIIRAGQVRHGMNLMDGRVESVESLGQTGAVRLWTAHPGWLKTADGLSIGSRWHEIIPAWAATEEERPMDEEGMEDYEAFPQIVPVAATGWLSEDGHGNPVGKPVKGYYDVWKGRPVNSAQLSTATHIRETFRKRGTTGAVPYSFVEQGAAREMPWSLPEAGPLPFGKWQHSPLGTSLARVVPAPHLRLAWSTPRVMTEMLVQGIEVVGSPMLADRHAMPLKRATG